MSSANELVIDPLGNRVIVNVVSLLEFTSDAAGLIPITWPQAITAPTSFYAAATGDALVSLEANSVEVATPEGAPTLVQMSGVVSLTPSFLPAVSGSLVALWPPLVPGRYYRFPNGGLSTAVATLDALRLSPVFIWQPCTLAQIGCEVTAGAASSFVRLGVYRDDGSFRPNLAAGPMLDTGAAIDGNSATVQTVACDVPLAAGWYWFGGVAQGGTPTLRHISSPFAHGSNRIDFDVAAPGAGVANSGFQVAAVSGALPTGGALAVSAATFAIHGQLN